MIKTRTFYFTIALTSLLVLFPIHLYPEDDVATTLYKEGLKKYILEDYRGAIVDFENAYRLKPEDNKIRKMLINTLVKQGNMDYEQKDLKSAEDYYLRAIALAGEDEEVQKKLIIIRKSIEEEKRLREKEAEVTRVYPEKRVVEPKLKEEEIAAVQPERIEVQLPFDMDKFIQQQNEENKKLLNEIIEAQNLERERLLKNVEEGQRILNENIQAQSVERKTLLNNVQESRRIFDQNIQAQREERVALLRNVEENQSILNKSIEAQRDEREYFLKNFMDIIQAQDEDRKLFSRSLMILVGGGIVIAIIIVLGFIMLLKRRITPYETAYYEPLPSIESKPKTLLEYTDKIDETKLITDENYSEIVKAKRLRELYQEFQKGNRSWDVIQGYISELNHEVKSEILSIVEKRIGEGDKGKLDNAFEILLPFIHDGDIDIGKKSRRMVRRISGEGEAPGGMPGGIPGEVSHEEEFPETEEGGDVSDPLSLSSLRNMARMADTKTGRVNHSQRVAEVAFRIAQALKVPELDPVVVKKVAMAHDIGYLEIDDSILKQEGTLTEEQFAIIKTHPESGLKLFQHVDLPQIFIDGIKYHHERLDGSGYPEGLEGEQIPPIARLLAVADFFDAVTSARPHRPALTISSCFQMMGKLAGKIFDRDLFNTLVELYKDEMDEEI